MYDCGDFSDEEGCFAMAPLEDPIREGAYGSPYTRGLLHWKVDGVFRVLSLHFDIEAFAEGAFKDMADSACRALLPGFRGKAHVSVETYK